MPIVGAAVALVIGACLIAGCGRAPVAAAGGRIPHPAFLRIARVPVGQVAIDPVSGTLYITTTGGIGAIDTANQEHQVFTEGPRDVVCGVAVDGVDHHLLVYVLRYGPHASTARFPKATGLVQMIDATTGALLSTVTMERLFSVCELISPPLVAVDSGTDHGFVTDAAGQSLEIDMDTGGVVRRFHIPSLSYFSPIFPSDAGPWVLDTGRHRLIASTIRHCSNSCAAPDTIVTVDTDSGQVVNRAPVPGAPVDVLSLDSATGRVYFRSDVLGGDIFTVDDRSGRLTARVRVAPLFSGDTLTGNVIADSGTHHAYLYIGGAALKGTGLPGKHNGPAHLIVVNKNGTRVLRRVPLPNPRAGEDAGAAFVDPVTNRLFIDVGAHLLVLDPSTLNVIQTIRLPNFSYNGYDGLILDTTNHRILAYGPRGIKALDEG